MKPVRFYCVVVLVFLVVPTSFDSSKAGESVQALTRSSSQAKALAYAVVGANFNPSLNMQEAADFLLTPALLQQEVVSGGVVITFPGQ